MDLSKFLALIDSERLWLTSAEVLAADDPHEGTLSTAHFLHRRLNSVDDLPLRSRTELVAHYSVGTDGSPAAAFNMYVMTQEQIGLMTQAGRRNYYVSCWHAEGRESVAMWKIYSAPGPGVAIISDSERMERALRSSEEKMYLGRVRYFDETRESIDWSNGFNVIMSKRASFAYEREVRLVYWDTEDIFDPLASAAWNEASLRYDDVRSNPEPPRPGISVECNLRELVREVVISPLAPSWYEALVTSLCRKLGYSWKIRRSRLMDEPDLLP